MLAVHENYGLNTYIEDVARRLAVAGYLAVAPDALGAVGGWPGNDDQGKALQAGLDRAKILVDMRNAASLARSHPLSNGRLGVTGFCFGGQVTAKVVFTVERHPGTQHGFHNDSTPRYDREGAERAWSRRLALFAETLRT